MDKLLASLGELLLKALPTFLLVVLLHFYLKRVYFRPMARLLKERYDATEGARALARESLAKAAEKAAEYEAALRAARAEIYHEQEQFRQSLRQEHAHAVQDGRRKAEALVKEARQQLAVEAAAARESLRRQSDFLAEEIVQSVLGGRPA